LDHHPGMILPFLAATRFVKPRAPGAKGTKDTTLKETEMVPCSNLYQEQGGGGGGIRTGSFTFSASEGWNKGVVISKNRTG